MWILLPPRGVYAVEVTLKDQAWVGVANIGVRPTVQELDRERLEVHILDFQTNIYDSVIEVVFMEKLREEVRFPDKTSLEKQIRKDVENVRMKFLAT
jgi:riboflavin kinase/FMN adenylyltransferase